MENRSTRHGNSKAEKVILAYAVLKVRGTMVYKGKGLIKNEGTYDTRHVRHQVWGETMYVRYKSMNDMRHMRHDRM